LNNNNNPRHATRLITKSYRNNHATAVMVHFQNLDQETNRPFHIHKT